MKYTCQCPRCDGTGRYDRGTCFTCKGMGYENKTRKPRALRENVLTVEFSNGTINTPIVWATSRAKAIEIVQRMLSIKGWTGSVS